jgi:DNA ligase (NAD+)
MDIKGCDAAFVWQLVAIGLVLDPSELYRLRLKELAALPGMDEEKAKALHEEIMAGKSRDAWRVLHGLSIPHVSAEEAKALCRGFRGLDDLFAAGKERIQTVGNVREIVANSIANWYMDSVNRRLVGRLWKYGVNFKSALYAQ